MPGKNGFCPAFRSAWLTRRFDALGVCQRNARDANETLGCTQTGNDGFPWFATRSSESRLNLLDLPRAGHTGCVLNEAAYGDMRKHHLSVPLIPSRACLPARLMAEPQTCFADEAAWLAHPGPARFHRAERDTRPGARRHRGRFMGQRPVAQVPLRCRRAGR
jgi:hypothetical protein